ncbi:CoB--CoM heterodisulfide reductase iron-sulfur subunit A family protein [Desulfobulbus rhabdoformis]|uniref:CoB--CoM heterodisulfide reductase iron-sulfur subunit A family protein n=1 Tax=Desulfobulbus rhabdoformis TaxID=34032 RepID=UPI001965B221|nr:FAD-dependent oxidoreductase [Desulfobulbus rhabdoformis]MBM9614657.1 CoB--CoM heterodisulfide reductase iron-sulfur subunit A family protein [Desulfobulbus rhabdoformis]
MSDTAGNGAILVVGGGISGITAALEAAEVGNDVFIIEKNPYFGGRVAQLNQYFPKLCPPTCGLEINFKRIKDNRKIRTYSLTTVKSISGGPGNYEVQLETAPRYINSNCTACGDCAQACTDEIDDEFNFGMGKTKAAYLPHEMAFPRRYVLKKEACSAACLDAVKAACKYNAVDLDMQPKTFTLKVSSIIWSTGWNPYDPEKITNLKFNSSSAIITNMMMERLAAPNGPTQGKILRPGDKKEPESFAFVQCAGSRDENHLEHCSYICCMATFKHISYIREQYPEAQVYVFYIDLRTPGKYEHFREKFADDANVTFVKGKVADITAERDGGVTVIAENALTGAKVNQKVDLCVLATGMQPALGEEGKALGVTMDGNGFVVSEPEKGMIAAGCAKSAVDVYTSGQSSTAAALKAIQIGQ